MKNDLVALVFIFVTVAVAIYTGFSSIATIHSVNTGNCAYNSSGSIVNCSLSDADYKQQNASATAAANIFSTLSISLWIVVAIIMLAAMLLFASLIRRR